MKNEWGWNSFISLGLKLIKLKTCDLIWNGYKLWAFLLISPQNCEMCCVIRVIVKCPVMLMFGLIFLGGFWKEMQVWDFVGSVQFSEVHVLCYWEWRKTKFRVLVAANHWETPSESLLICPWFLFWTNVNTRWYTAS